jgi:hypothetical protein
MVLVVAVSLAGVALEKKNLELRREVSRQHYRLDVLLESHARLRLRSQQLGAPVRVMEQLEQGGMEVPRAGVSVPSPSVSESPRMPLLRWQRGTPVGR